MSIIVPVIKPTGSDERAHRLRALLGTERHDRPGQAGDGAQPRLRHRALASRSNAAVMSAESEHPRTWLVLAAMAAAVAVVTLDTTILNVAIPTIRRDLHTDLTSLQWVIA